MEKVATSSEKAQDQIKQKYELKLHQVKNKNLLKYKKVTKLNNE